jgi:hypothetical protein
VHSRWPRRLGLAAVAVLVIVLCDLAAAWIATGLAPDWNPEVIERRYRVPHPIYHHALRPLVTATGLWGRQYSVATNSLGFRDGTARVVNPPAPHVLLLGDSFTEGLGVSYDSSFAGRLASASGADILNAGVSSYSPVIYERKARYWIEERGLHVTGMIVAIDLSDMLDEASRYRVDAHGNVVDAASPSVSQRATNWLLEHSALAFLIWLGKNWWDSGAPGWSLGLGQARTTWNRDAVALARYGAVGLRRAMTHMTQLAALAKRHGIPLVVVIYPWPDEIMNRAQDCPQVRAWTAWADTARVPLVNLFPRFLSGEPEATIRRYFIRGDVHWNAAGHRLVADALLASPAGELLR